MWVRSFDTIEELRLALLEFKRTYNEQWMLDAPLRCDVTSSGWTRQHRCEYRQTTVQEPWGATRVTNWKNGEMALRWSAVAFVETEKNYRRITGYEHLWMLKAHLDRDDDNIAEMQKVG